MTSALPWKIWRNPWFDENKTFGRTHLHKSFFLWWINYFHHVTVIFLLSKISLLCSLWIFCPFPQTIIRTLLISAPWLLQDRRHYFHFFSSYSPFRICKFPWQFFKDQRNRKKFSRWVFLVIFQYHFGSKKYLI